MIATFQVICVPLAILNISFHILVILFSVVSLILFVISVSQVRLNGLTVSQVDKKAISPEIKGLVAFLLLVICVQIGTLIVYGVYKWGADDASYLAISDSAIKHDVLFRYNSYTGVYEGLSIDQKRLTTTYHIFIAFLGKISGIHVLEIAHTILPIFLIPLSYCAFYIFSHLLFDNELKKSLVFMIMLSLMVAWGAFSSYTITFRMLVVPWQGKSLMSVIFMPFLLYYLFQIFINDWNSMEAFVLIMICIAGQSTSLMANGLFVFTVYAIFLCAFKLNRKWILKNVSLVGAFTLICGLDTLFYLFYDNLINILGLE
ncbi:MAG: hypothetical protein J1E61_00445 [Lachnospiraceae bacterium]|nr:hypothetical protein [Lachnospiraceae bacterium]